MSWKDENGVIRNDPFQLHKNNYLPYELYDRIIDLSDTKQYTIIRNNNTYKGNFPTLSAMEFVLSNFIPESTTADELDFILEKISIIHTIRLNNFLG